MNVLWRVGRVHKDVRMACENALQELGVRVRRQVSDANVEDRPELPRWHERRQRPQCNEERTCNGQRVELREECGVFTKLTIVAATRDGSRVGGAALAMVIAVSFEKIAVWIG